jgi:pimeloyl-ACP methyl ester carboxylesterase
MRPAGERSWRCTRPQGPYGSARFPRPPHAHLRRISCCSALSRCTLARSSRSTATGSSARRVGAPSANPCPSHQKRPEEESDAARSRRVVRRRGFVRPRILAPRHRSRSLDHQPRILRLSGYPTELGQSSLEDFLVPVLGGLFLDDRDANNLLTKLWTWQHGDIGRTPGFDGSLERALASIEARAILMPGEKDLYFPPEDNEWEARHMPSAELRVIPQRVGATSREAAPIRSTPDLSTRRSRTCSPAPRRDHPQPRRGRDAGRPGFSAVGPVTMAGLPLPGATLDVTSSWARALVRAPERSSWRFEFVLVPVWPGLRRRPC